MSPLRVEVDGRHIGDIRGVGHIDLSHPLNAFAFGGRVTYYSDQLGDATIIGPEGNEVSKTLSRIGDMLTLRIDISNIRPHKRKMYTITAKRT